MIKAASVVAFRSPPLKTFNCTFHDTGWALIFPLSASGKTVGMLLLPEVIGAGFLGAADWLFSPPWLPAGHRKYLGTLALLHVGLGIFSSCLLPPVSSHSFLHGEAICSWNSRRPAKKFFNSALPVVVGGWGLLRVY